MRPAKPHLSTIVGAVLAFSMTGCAVTEEPHMPVVRFAELEIDPAQLEAYTAAVKEEMETSVRIEPGVLATYAVGNANTNRSRR